MAELESFRSPSSHRSILKLIKIRFTSWRDKSAAPRKARVQGQLDAWIERLSKLFVEAARINDRQVWTDNGELKKKAAAIAAEMQKVDVERLSLLSAEQAERNVATRAASEHKKVGTFGYQVFNKAGTYVAMIVDEAGDYLPVEAVYSYALADDNPPLPEWAKKGKVGRFD